MPQHPTSEPSGTDTGFMQVSWCALDGAEVLAQQAVDAGAGLSSAEVTARRESFGANRLAEPEQRSKLSMFIDQFRSSIVMILFAAAIIAGVVGHVKDTIVILVVLVINAVFGYVQEGKASGALAALERMLITIVRVRRDGQVQEVPAEELVPGDIVLLEAGDRVPADGRIFFAANASVDESSLTGESVPVDKIADHRAEADAPLGDQHGMGFMNTTLVRGRLEVVITATGMRTEMGKVADLISAAEESSTPLERQLDSLGRRLAVLAGLAALAVLVLQTLRGADLGVALLDSIALAVAAIPEGLPAVVTVTLAIGVARMAKRNAIVKRLHSVETLGATSVICSDKTGTLTLNQMTARRVLRSGTEWRLSGEGYATQGVVTTEHGLVVDHATAQRAGLAMALCSDAVVGLLDENGDPAIVGDPTEAALVVAAAKFGIDATEVRVAQPRLGEVPFDSATKFMATFHRVDPDDASSDVLICVKGAPDVLLGRAAFVIDGDGLEHSITAQSRQHLLDDNDRLAAEGMRVLAVATRIVDAETIVNDAAALRHADIGVAMGITGTEVTKEASDMVLADDNFATIVEAVKGGRAIYDNIIKFVRFQLSTNVSAITTILGASLLGWPVPFTPLQILWVNLIADGPPAITLGTDTPGDRVMERPPVRPGSAILSGGRILRIVFTGGVMAASLLLLFWGSLQHYELSVGDFAADYENYSPQAQLVLTMMFMTFVFQQLFNVFNARTETESIFRRRTPNRSLGVVVGVLVLIQLCVVKVEPLREIFRTVDLGLAQIGVCVGIALVIVITEELRKALDRLLIRRREDAQ